MSKIGRRGLVKAPGIVYTKRQWDKIITCKVLAGYDR